MPDGTKYDSVLDALKMTQSGYESEIAGAALEFVEQYAGYPPSTGDIRNWSRDYLDDHEWFAEFDGATYGAIVEFADVDAHDLTRWHLQTNAADSLRVMAEEAMIEDIVASVRESVEQVDDGELVTDGGRSTNDTDRLEAEAEALVDLFNDAAPDHSPELEWFAMSLDHETERQSFVLEAENYIDSDGLAALRDAGRTVTYIEAYQKPPSDEVYCQIQVPVQGNMPDRSVGTDAEQEVADAE